MPFSRYLFHYTIPFKSDEEELYLHLMLWQNDGSGSGIDTDLGLMSPAL